MSEQGQEPEQAEVQPEAAEAAPEQSAPKIKVESYLGEEEYDLTNEEHRSAVAELAQAGYKSKQALEEARKLRETAKGDVEFAGQMKALLNQHPGLRNVVQSVVQTGKMPDMNEPDPDLVDGSERQMKADVNALQQQIESLRSEIQESKASSAQEKSEKRIDAALNKHAEWMKQNPTLRDMAKSMIALQVSEHDVDPGIAAIQVTNTLKKSLNVDKQREYEEIVKSREEATTVRPSDGAPTTSEPRKYDPEDWKPRNRRNHLGKIVDGLREKYGVK